MSSNIQQGSRKRGRPAKYASHEERKQADTKRKRAKRQAKNAAEREAQFDQFYFGQHPQAVSSHHAAIPQGLSIDTDAADIGSSMAMSIENDEIGQLLPPLSPLRSPSPDPLPIDTEPHVVDETRAESSQELREMAGDTTTGTEMDNTNGDSDAVTRMDNTNEDSDAVTGMDNTNGDSDAVTTDVPGETAQVHELASQITHQLTQHQGCCAHCHKQSRDEHEEKHIRHFGLQEYLNDVKEAVDYADILSSETMATREANLAEQTSAGTKRRIYCGSEDPASPPVHICLEAEDRPNAAAEVTFDIDSIVGFPTSLAIAKQGIRWHPTQMPVSDLQSDMHLNTRPVHYLDSHGHAHTVRRPIHQIPHYTFGRLVGFEDVSLHLLFPHLYREEQQSSRLLDHDFRIWMDRILRRRNRPGLQAEYSQALQRAFPS